MAFVKNLSQDVIRTLGGQIDFYFWRGQAVCRRWPRAPRQPNTPGQLEARAAFTASRTELKKMTAQIRALWVPTYIGKRQAWLDYYTAMFLSYRKATGRNLPVIYSFKSEPP